MSKLQRFRQSFRQLYAFHTSPSNLVILDPLGKPFWPLTTHPEVFHLGKTTPATEGASPPGVFGNFTISSGYGNLCGIFTCLGYLARISIWYCSWHLFLKHKHKLVCKFYYNNHIWPILYLKLFHLPFDCEVTKWGNCPFEWQNWISICFSSYICCLRLYLGLLQFS